MAAQSDEVSAIPPITNLLRIYSIVSSRSVMKTLTETGPHPDHWGTPQTLGLQVDSAPLITTLRALPFTQFSIHLTLHSSNPHFLSFPTRIFRETASKALCELDSENYIKISTIII